MSIINKVRLEEFANGLWAKIKTKIGEGIVNLSYDHGTNMLTATKEKGEEVQVNLNELATTWENLEHTSIQPTFNLFDPSNVVDNSIYNASGDVAQNAAWKRVTVNVKHNTEYRISKRAHDSSDLVFLEENETKVEKIRLAGRMENGWHTYIVQVPNNPSIKKIGFNIHKATNPTDEIMVYEGTSQPPTEFVPFDPKIFIDGENIKISFNPKDSGLTSQTVENALIELAQRIINVGNGTVTSVNGVNPDQQGAVRLTADNFADIYSKDESDGRFLLLSDVDNSANKVPRLDDSGKLATTVLPKITINETVTSVGNTEQEAQQAAMRETVENGDMLVLQIGSDPGRIVKKYLCIDATSGEFSDKFIELTFPTDGVTEGELTLKLADYVLISDTGTSANKVLRLDNQGKIDDVNLKIVTEDEINSIINNLT